MFHLLSMSTVWTSVSVARCLSIRLMSKPAAGFKSFTRCAFWSACVSVCVTVCVCVCVSACVCSVLRVRHSSDKLPKIFVKFNNYSTPRKEGRREKIKETQTKQSQTLKNKNKTKNKKKSKKTNIVKIKSNQHTSPDKTNETRVYCCKNSLWYNGNPMEIQ